MAAMAVQHNMQSINANRLLGITTSQQKKSTEKLSSGYRINRAGDDAAGLAISEKMRGQIRGLNKASTNASDGISLIQTAEGGLNETHSIIQRMRELAVQASTDTNTDDDRTQIQNEIDQLTQEVDRIANTTEFNTKKLLNGDRKGAVTQRDGTNSIEGTFQNAKVSVATTLSNLNAAFNTQVIRIEVTSGLNSVGDTSDSSFKVEYLHGSGTGMARIVSISSDGQFRIASDAQYAISGTDGETFVSTDDGTSEAIIKIDGWEKLQAGDVITITVGKATAQKSAEEGKDSLRFQVGASAGQEVTLGINSMRTKDLDISDKVTGRGLKLTSQSDASKAINAYDLAIQRVSTERAKLGAVQNRLEHTIDNLDSAAENTQSAESGIRDTDMASEMVIHSKNNILAQAGQSMLAQANQSTQGVLSLLG